MVRRRHLLAPYKHLVHALVRLWQECLRDAHDQGQPITHAAYPDRCPPETVPTVAARLLVYRP